MESLCEDLDWKLLSWKGLALSCREAAIVGVEQTVEREREREEKHAC